MTTINGVVRKVRRLRNTLNGNPRYSVVIETHLGDTFTGVTDHDAMFVYAVSWDTLQGKVAVIEYKSPRVNNYIVGLVVI